MIRSFLFGLLAMVALGAGCTGSHRPRGDGGPGDDGAIRIDGGPRPDAAMMCVIDCVAPPLGCHYEGAGSCEPPRCPPLVCEDAGTDIACGVGTDPRFPEFDRSCGAVSDCYLARHLTDCCGTIHAMGVSSSERDRFEAAEAVCASMYPACGCFSSLVTADDGTSNEGGGEPTLICAAGVCTTTFAR